MTQISSVTSNEPTLHAALELSKNSWLLAIQFPDRDKPSLYPLAGGDVDGLLAKLNSARNRLAKLTGQVRKLAIALWRYLETGLIPEGATLSGK